MERKLLDILDADDSDNSSAEVSEETVASAFPYLDEEMRKKLARLLVSEMKTPEEIEQAAKIAEHNAEVQQKRDEDLAKRRERRSHRKRK